MGWNGVGQGLLLLLLPPHSGLTQTECSRSVLLTPQGKGDTKWPLGLESKFEGKKTVMRKVCKEYFAIFFLNNILLPLYDQL